MEARDEWLERVASIRRWSRGGERAPHKPLLLLYALGQLQRTGASTMTYVDAEPHLAQLLRDYGPTNRTTTPAYPFHHLQTDGLWVVHAEHGDPGSSPGRLRSSGATGHLDPTFEDALRRDPALIALIAHSLLDANFPESLHHDLSAAAGLDLEALEASAARGRVQQLRRRDPNFRELVLVAYEYRCAMCGYDGRMGPRPSVSMPLICAGGRSTVPTQSTMGSVCAASTTSCSTVAYSASQTTTPSPSHLTSSVADGRPTSSCSGSSASRYSNPSPGNQHRPMVTSVGMVSRCSGNRLACPHDAANPVPVGRESDIAALQRVETVQ